VIADADSHEVVALLPGHSPDRRPAIAFQLTGVDPIELSVVLGESRSAADMPLHRALVRLQELRPANPHRRREATGVTGVCFHYPLHRVRDAVQRGEPVSPRDLNPARVKSIRRLRAGDRVPRRIQPSSITYGRNS
jgi:hypothetical protein